MAQDVQKGMYLSDTSIQAAFRCLATYLGTNVAGPVWLSGFIPAEDLAC